MQIILAFHAINSCVLCNKPLHSMQLILHNMQKIYALYARKKCGKKNDYRKNSLGFTCFMHHKNNIFIQKKQVVRPKPMLLHF